MMRTAIACLARLLLALGLCAASVACGGAAPTAGVTILIPWDPTSDPGEYNAFMTVIDQFTKETGITVTPQVTRGVTQQLDTDLAASDPPDIADLPNPGAVYHYKDHLQPLQIDLTGYAQPWRSLAMLGTPGTVYAVPVKADVQSLIWYSTSAVKSPPKSWAGLQSLSSQPGTPWCLGLASGVASGWPGADWIANILISRYGADEYQSWLNGTLAWDSFQVKDAWRTWGKLMRRGGAVPGGAAGALNTPFNFAMPMASGQCAAQYGALINTGLSSTAGYGYVQFPSISSGASPILVSGDFMGLFTDNADARTLLSYLAREDYQALWVGQVGGDAFSADQAIPLAHYPLGVRRSIAGLQLGAGTELCFVANDLMLPDVSAAFERTVLKYVNNLDSLDSLLGSLQRIQKTAHSSPLWNLACSGPS